MKIKQTMLATVASSVLITGIAVDSPVQAQSLAIEEITVTARKREESLLEVPLAITAISELQIERTGIDNVADLAFQTPGFSMRQGFGRQGGGNGGGASNRPSIRGMTNILGQPTTGFFVDGVYVSGNITSYQLDNLSRVEILRGPQSALFGRGTFAGAVSFVTRKPDNEFRGKVSLTGGQYDNFEGTGYVSGPLVEDKLFLEVNGRYYDFGGDYFNYVTNERDGGDERSWNLGGKIYATPNDNLTIDIMINYSDDQDKGYADNWHGSEKNNCFLPTPSGASFFGIPLTVNRSQGYFCGELELPGKLFVYDNTRIEAAGFHVLERESWRSSARIDYDLENDWSITSITAYNTFNDLQILDAGTTQFFRAGNNPSFSGAYTGRSDWSQELKVFSPQDESFSGFAGVYYYEENDDDGFLTSLQTATGLFDPATNSPSDVITNPFLEASSVRNWAVFGHIDIDMTDDWTFSAEARYQEDRITADGDTDGVIDLPALVDQQETFTAFLPRVSVSYKGIEDWNLYAAIAKGNRPGGFNILPSSATAASRAQFIADGFGTFDEDTVWSYELGAKGAFLDGRATLESAAFWLDWSNQQLTNGIPYDRVGTSPTTFATIVNAGQSRIRGFEADFNFAATDQFSFRVGYSYNDAEIRDFNDSVTEDLFDTDGLVGDADLAGDPSGQLRGNKLPQTPAHMLIVSGSYTQPVTDDIDAFFRADMSYESKRYVQVHNLAHTGDSYNLNLRAGVESDAWTVTVFLNNALNDKTPLVGTRLLDFTSTLLIPDPVTSFIFLQNRRFTFERDFRLGMPRKQAWGVTATYKF